jgi:hypothetical protein
MDVGRASQPGPPGAPCQPGPPCQPRARGILLPRASARFLGWAAVAGLSTAILIMIVVTAAGPSAAVVRMPAPAAGPPWWFPGHLALRPVLIALWAAVVSGCAGTAAGLAAVARGARPPARLLLAGALLVTAVLTVLPPAGSTDALDYAAYGRTVVIGRSPYVMTPRQLRRAGDPIGRIAPKAWATRYSPYGPLATAEQAAAAALGGPSAARVTFWLKLWNALAFGAVAAALDRLLRSDPARRARAHLLWSLNPLLLWNLVAAGHVDALAVAFGFLGLVLAAGRRPGEAPGPLASLAAGAAVGAAADIKITFALFGLAVAWVTRKAPRSLAAAALGGLAVLVPSYLWSGPRAIKVLANHGTLVTRDNFYQLFSRPFGHPVPPHLLWVVVPLLLAVAALLLAQLPRGFASRPAIRPALALSAAFLLVWPYQFPWYDAMALAPLALYPASRLDWAMLIELAAGTFFSLPGVATGRGAGWPEVAFRLERYLVAAILLGVLVTVAAWAVTGDWQARGRPAGSG